MKKLFKLSLVVVMVALVGFFLVGCNKENKKEENMTRVTVDINPSIEIIVDEDDKVVSVTALNDEGNIIIVGETIVGKTVEEAVNIIVSVATETGYLVKGEVEASENEIKVSVSGDEAAQTELYNKIKGEIENVVANYDLEALVVQKEALKLEALKELAKEADPSLTEEELAQMNEQQLLNVLKKVRLERAELYSLELEKVYNQTKEYEIKLVEREETKKVIDALDGEYQKIKEEYASLVESFSNVVNSVEKAYYDNLVDPESSYQQKYLELLNTKAELISQKEEVANLEEGLEKELAKKLLEAKLQEYNLVLQALDTMYEFVSKTIEACIAELRVVEQRLIAYQNSLPASVKENLTAKATEIETACNNAKDKFFEEFEKEYSDEIAYYKNLMLEQKAQLKEETK